MLLYSSETSVDLYQTNGVTYQKTGNSIYSAVEAPYIPMTSDRPDDCILLLTIGTNAPLACQVGSGVNHTQPKATRNPGEEVEMKPHTEKLTHSVLTKWHLREMGEKKSLNRCSTEHCFVNKWKSSISPCSRFHHISGLQRKALRTDQTITVLVINVRLKYKVQHSVISQCCWMVYIAPLYANREIMKEFCPCDKANTYFIILLLVVVVVINFMQVIYTDVYETIHSKCNVIFHDKLFVFLH